MQRKSEKSVNIMSDEKKSEIDHEIESGQKSAINAGRINVIKTGRKIFSPIYPCTNSTAIL